MFSITNKFAATLYINNMLLPNFWNITINIMPSSDANTYNSNIAMDRIQYYIENVLDDSLLLGPTGVKLFDKNPLKIECTCNLLPDDPLDYLLTICLYTKFNSIVESMLFIDSVILDSYQANGIKHTYNSTNGGLNTLRNITDNEFLEYCNYWYQRDPVLFKLNADGLQLMQQTWADIDLAFNVSDKNIVKLDSFRTNIFPKNDNDDTTKT